MKEFLTHWETLPDVIQKRIAHYLDTKNLCFFAASSKRNLKNTLPLLHELQQKLLNPSSFFIDAWHSTWLGTSSAIYVCGSDYQDGNGLGLQRRFKKDPFKQVTAIKGTIKQIAFRDHDLILLADQTLWVCGCNEQGQLGLGYFSEQETLKQLYGVKGKIQQVAAGRGYSFVLTEQGLWACGANSYGCLGLGYGDFTHIPTLEPVTHFEGTPLQIATGENHTLLLTDKGLWACGKNNSGQLGLGHNKDCYIFHHVTGISEKILRIFAGSDYTLITTEKGLWACGDNNSGQLGLGNTDFFNTFQPITSLSGKILQISAGRFHTLVFTDEGAWICGSNNSGQLGLGLTINREAYCSIFQRISSIKGHILQVAAGDSSSFILTDQELWVCGDNLHTQLGLKFDEDEYYINTFTPVTLLPKFFKQQLSLYRYIEQLKAIATTEISAKITTKLHL